MSGFLTQLYSLVLDIVEHRADNVTSDFLKLSYIPQSLIKSNTVLIKNVTSDFLKLSYIPQSLMKSNTVLIKNIKSDFLTQLYSPVLEIVEHRVDKERNVKFSNSVTFPSRRGRRRR